MNKVLFVQSYPSVQNYPDCYLIVYQILYVLDCLQRKVIH